MSALLCTLAAAEHSVVKRGIAGYGGGNGGGYGGGHGGNDGGFGGGHGGFGGSGKFSFTSLSLHVNYGKA